MKPVCKLNVDLIEAAERDQYYSLVRSENTVYFNIIKMSNVGFGFILLQPYPSHPLLKPKYSITDTDVHFHVPSPKN